MSKVSNGKRVVFVGLLVSLIAGFYLSFGGRQNNAQIEFAKTPDPRITMYYGKSDEVTASIRNKDSRLLQIEVDEPGGRAAAEKFGTIVGDFGSFIVLSKDKPGDISKSGLAYQRIDTTVHLPSGSFEPLTSSEAKTIDAGREIVGDGYYIVQFGGPVTDEWLESVKSAGVEILQYVPHQAFFVYGSSEAIRQVAGHSRVRWVGEFDAAHKISPSLTEFARSSESETAKFDIAVFSRADIDGVQKRIAETVESKFFGRLSLANNFFGVIRAEIPVADLNKIAAIPDVVRIDPFIPPQAEDERAAQIVAGNFQSTTSLLPPGYNPLGQFGVDGSNVTVMVSDDGVSIPGVGGLYLTAGNTIDAPLRGATSGAGGGHGHLNASIIAGAAPFGQLDPLGYNYGLGIAPKANIINVPFLKNGYPTDASSDAVAVDDALNTIAPNGARGTISNNSWGDGLNSNSYDSLAARYDSLVRDGSFGPSIDPFTIIFSAGNSGPAGNSLTRPKTAKNIIVVGNSENVRPELGGSAGDNIDDLRSSSSRGPTADGRIKPDVTAPGTYVTGGRAGNCTSVGSCFDANHAWSTGTSHSAPQVAGIAALFTQHWRNSHAGAYPFPSLIKAAILSSGQEMSGLTTADATIPNGNEGWGRVNMRMILNTGVPMKYINQDVPLFNPGEEYTLSGTVHDPSKPVRVALVWTDPPAAADPALVNNLNVEVSVGGQTYKGNVFAGGFSVAGGSADTKDNVEMVFLPAGIPAGTPFNIKVTAAALNGDGVLGNGDVTDQDFSLVAYNFTDAPAAAFWTVSGMAITPDGRGISNATVRLVNESGETLVAVTNPFGYFTFFNVPGGRVYTASVASKRYTFQPQTFAVNQNATNVIFTPSQ